MNTKAIDTRLKKLEAETSPTSPEFDPSWLSEEKRKEWERNIAIVGDIGDCLDDYKSLPNEKRAAICALNEIMITFYQEAGALNGPFNIWLLSHEEVVARLADLEAERHKGVNNESVN